MIYPCLSFTASGDLYIWSNATSTKNFIIILQTDDMTNFYWVLFELTTNITFLLNNKHSLGL